MQFLLSGSHLHFVSRLRPLLYCVNLSLKMLPKQKPLANCPFDVMDPRQKKEKSLISIVSESCIIICFCEEIFSVDRTNDKACANSLYFEILCCFWGKTVNSVFLCLQMRGRGRGIGLRRSRKLKVERVTIKREERIGSPASTAPVKVGKVAMEFHFS